MHRISREKIPLNSLQLPSERQIKDWIYGWVEKNCHTLCNMRKVKDKDKG